MAMSIGAVLVILLLPTSLVAQTIAPTLLVAQTNSANSTKVVQDKLVAADAELPKLAVLDTKLSVTDTALPKVLAERPAGQALAQGGFLSSAVALMLFSMLLLIVCGMIAGLASAMKRTPCGNPCSIPSAASAGEPEVLLETMDLEQNAAE
mmetsp:Transcript_109586/g.193699  ORF Transcript_109586/g.193699 Transcript_109586/m.193699 type:complete len:151 (+) Transcript_109586:61-513(+)